MNKPIIGKIQKAKRIIIPDEMGFEPGDIIIFEKLTEKEIKLTKLTIEK